VDWATPYRRRVGGLPPSGGPVSITKDNTTPGPLGGQARRKARSDFYEPRPKSGNDAPRKRKATQETHRFPSLVAGGPPPARLSNLQQSRWWSPYEAGLRGDRRGSGGRGGDAEPWRVISFCQLASPQLSIQESKTRLSHQKALEQASSLDNRLHHPPSVVFIAC